MAAVDAKDRERRRRGTLVLAPLLLLTGVVVVVFVGRPSVPDPVDGLESGIVRSAPTVEQRSIAVTVPAPGGTVSRTDSVFAWRPVAANATYRVRILTTAGEEVLRAETVDSTVIVDVGRLTPAGLRYYWVVDAILEDGRTATSGMNEVHVMP